MTGAMTSLVMAEETEGNITRTNDTFQSRDLSEIMYSMDYEGFATMITVEKYCIPIICVFGLIGNSVSTIIFLQRHLRKAPCSFYLASRGISDNGFLFILLLTWMSSTFDLRLSQVKGVCQTIVFLTYLFGCVSVWLCVFITFENFLLIHSPFVARRICSEKFAVSCTIVLVIMAVGVYNTSLWIMNADCSHNPAFSELTQVLVYFDTCITLVVPTVIIFILLSMIMYKVIKIVHLRRVHANLIGKLADRSRTVKSVIPIAKVTNMLLVVSLMFFLLNVPIHGIKIRLLIGRFTQGKDTTTFVQATVQSAFQLLYYFSFSVNIIVYTVFGSNFRQAFLRTFCCKRTTITKNFTTEAVNLVSKRRHTVIGEGDAAGDTAFLMVPITDQRLCHSDML